MGGHATQHHGRRDLQAIPQASSSARHTRTTGYQRFGHRTLGLHASTCRHQGRRGADMMSADSALKEVYRSVTIMGPKNAAAAIGDGLEQMLDTARNMRSRITV
jgi:hypothetical protein